MEDIKCDDVEVQELMDEADNIHRLWHGLNEYVEKFGRNISTLSGWDDIRMMDSFCEKHPEIIRVHVDDSYHCNSYLYIVPHESEKRYMGATVIVVPQCCDERNQFFLYPGDNRDLLSACLRLEDKFQGKGDKRFVSNGDFDEDGKDTED